MADSYAASARRFGEDKAKRFAGLRQRYGVPDLAPLTHATGQALI
jgi:uncharacterized protein